MQPVARFGFVSRGFVYMLVGVLAAAAAGGFGGRATDPQGAIQTVGAERFGAALLLVLALGLACYATWRFMEAALDLDGRGNDLRGLAARLSFAVSGAGHAVLAVSAGSIGIGLHQGRSNAVRVWTGWLMSEPYGRWVVGAIGATVIGVAVAQFYSAYTCGFEANLRKGAMSAAARRWVRRIGRAGLSARGVTFGIMGWFLVQAARTFDAHQARGLAGSLRSLAHHDDGPWLLGIVAVGLTAYGVMSLVDARYRSIGA